MAARCRKFVPNLFNKTKCQSCFGAKEAHTAEALESSKAARKISKCAYLFVSPDLDFSNPLHRTKRWQRRFFILYDDGELTYSVDDNPSTIPQGSVDMNKCTDVFDADEKTGHEYSIGITVPNNPTSYVKGTSRDEIRRWFDVLVMYPRSLTIKTKRGPGSKQGGGGLSRHLSYYPAGTEKSISDDEDADSVHSKDSGDTYERSSRTRGRYKQRDMRRSKSEVRPSDLKLAEDEYNKKIPGQLSLPQTSASQTKFSRERNIDGFPARRAGEPETFSSVRSMKHRKAAKSQAVQQQSSDAAKPTPQLAQTAPGAADSTTATPGGVSVVDGAVSAPLNRRLSIPNMSALSKVPDHKSLSRTTSAVTATGGASGGGGGAFTAFVFPPSTPNAAGASGVLIDANETDEHKIAKNENAKKSLEKSPIVRKGWLLVRQDTQSNVWSKHWFVLCGTSLSYYKDAKAEETNQIDGVIDVRSAYEVSTIKAERNHGFRIQTKEGEYTLSAMTSGIRRNWIEAVESIIGEIRRAREKSARQDMGFVFESPLRSPRTLGSAAAAPAAAASAAAPSQNIAPVVPDPTSRVNSTLREMAERRRETGDDRPLEELYEVVPPIARKDSACSDTEREVSVLTSKQEVTSVPGAPSPKPATEVPPPPKSPSAFVSPSQRIKEKSRAKTPPRSRSPPPPSPIPITSHHAVSSKTSTPVDRMLLLPTGSSSDENDESLTAKLLESQKQVQHLQQQVQDVNSMVRKQRVEIESLQTKLDLTTSQLRDMETALTHSAQSLNKERKNSSRLNEAIEGFKHGHIQNNEYQAKCSLLERQLQETTHKLATQEVKMAMVSSLEDQLQVRTSKLATLEKVLGNTRRHLQDAVENVRETELHYQTKVEELEHDYEKERVQLQEKLHQMEDKLDKLVTESNNSVNADLGRQLMKEKVQSMRRLEELVKEQKGKIDQLTEESALARQQIDDLQCFKDSAAVNQNHLESVQHKYDVLQTSVQSLESSLAAIRAELEVKDSELVSKCQENASLLATIDELQDKCRLVQDSQVSSSDLARTYENERELLREELESVTLELNSALEASRAEIESLRRSHSEIVGELRESNTKIQSLKNRCSLLEVDLKKERTRAVAGSAIPPPPPPQQTPSTAVTPGADQGGYTLNQVVGLISVVARCCERMTESAVAMLAGEMIETDIKVSINFNQEQRTALGNKTVEQLLKKFAGVRQRLNYMVKNSVTKKLHDELQSEKCVLAEQLANSGPSGGVIAPRSEESGELTSGNASECEFLTAMLERCRADILCISTDITRLDISHIETKLQSLSSTLQCLDDNQHRSTKHFNPDISLANYCNKLAVQAAAMFEMARTLSSGVNLSKILVSLENCLKSTSGGVTSIEDLSLRNYALLISERLLISYELDHLVLAGQWKGFADQQQSEDFTTKSLVAETLQRIEMFASSKGRPLGDACLNICLSTLLQQNIAGRPSIELLRNESSLISKLVQTLDTSLTNCSKEYCFQYTTDLVNFGTLEIGEVDSLLTDITKSLCRQIKRLVSKGNLSELSSSWLYEQVCLACGKVKGLEPKDMPGDLVEISLNLSMLESKFEISSSLITKRETSTLSQSLVSEACKLAGLSSELARKASTPGSMEERIAALAHRLEQTDRLLSAYSGHYGDTVQQVMREVVNSLQMSVQRYQLGAGDSPTSSNEQSLIQQVEQLKLQLQTANKRCTKLVNADQHEKTVEALHDQMSSLKVEHSTELDESKRDMKMVLKSVKAEEYRLATELTEQISELKDELAEEKRTHQIELLRLKELKPDVVSAEEHVQLKDKVRDLENCLHEMQEEFEEELYQERRSHLAELEKTRAELLDVVNKASSQQLSADELRGQYETIIDKLKAEQASLQQWIDDIREAHRDEMDALQHERDAALADEVSATQAALEAMQSSHTIELEQERSRLRDLTEKAAHLAQVERDLLLQMSGNANKEKRIVSLEAKVSSSTKKLAKLEVGAAKSADVVCELSALNEKLTDRNSQLVEKFSQELSKINTTASGKSSADGQTMALKAQVESLSERLRSEQLGRRQLEEKLESVAACYEQELRQREEDVQLEVAASSSVSASPPEDLLLRRRLPAGSPSLHAQRSSSPVFALSSSPRSGGGSSSSSSSSTIDSSSDPKATGSPRRLADRAYDLMRSKSTPTMEKRLTYTPSKRLSASEEPPSRHLPVLDTNDRGFVQYQKSGGISLADRMRKFT